MKHATVFDAFNAAAGFTHQTLGYLTEKEMEENERQLEKDYYDFDIQVKNIIRDTPYKGSKDEYEKAIQTEINKLFDDPKNGYLYNGKNNSPYYQRMMNDLRDKSLLKAQGLALEKEDEWNWTQADIDYANSTEAYKNEDGWTIAEGIKAIQAASEDNKKRNPQRSTQESEALLQAHLKDYFQRYAARAAGKVSDEDLLKDSDALKKVLGNVKKEFLESGLLPEGYRDRETDDEGGAPENVRDTDKEDGAADKPGYDRLAEDERKTGGGKTLAKSWGYEWLDDYIKKAAEDEDFKRFYTAEAKYRRFLEIGDINGADNIAKKYGPQWDKRYKDKDYNADYLTRGRNYFDSGEAAAHHKQGARGDITLLMKENWYGVINAFLSGGGVRINGVDVPFESLEDAYDYYLTSRELAFKDAKGYGNYGEDYDRYVEELWEVQRGEELRTFHDKLREVMTDRNDALKPVFDHYTNFNTYVTEKYKKDPQKYAERADYANRCMEFAKALVLRYGVTDPQQIVQAMNVFMGEELINLTKDWKNNTALDYPGEQQKKDAALYRVLIDNKTDDAIFINLTRERRALPERVKIPMLDSATTTRRKLLNALR